MHKKIVDNIILSLILDGKTPKEAWDTLGRIFGVRGSIEVEKEGGSIVEYLQQSENFVESQCAQPQVDDVYEEFAEDTEKENINACEPQCAQPQVDENLINPTTNLVDENLVNPTTEYADENLVNPTTELANDNLMNLATKLADENFEIFVG